MKMLSDDNAGGVGFDSNKGTCDGKMMIQNSLQETATRSMSSVAIPISSILSFRCVQE